MRLIDADKLKEEYRDDTEIGNSLRMLVDMQETAFDIDKVVEELQERASRHTKKYTAPYGGKGYKDVKAIQVSKAIEIVKRGGKNG